MIMDRGVTTSGLTRVMEIEGARNACCSDFARIDFRNIDSDDQNVEYVGARISSANVFGDDSGYLYFYVADNYNSLDLRQMISANPNIGALFWSDLETEGSITPMTDDSYDLGSPSYRWDDVWATNAFIQTSDRRNKIDVRRLDYGLNSIMALQPVRFNWLDKQGAGEKLGLIAQDVMQVIPEVVVTTNTVTDLQTGETTTEDAERLGMRYADLIPVLINAIQEQQTMITDLQEENSAIRSKLERLEKSLTSTAAAN